MMKKSICFSAFALALMFSLISFTGCANANAANTFTYDMLLKYPVENVGENDRIVFESLEEYKNHIVASGAQSILGAVKCKKITYYVTLEHSNGLRFISGKSIAECELISASEKIGISNVKGGDTLKIVQSVYIMPKNDEDLEEMFRSFGAVISKDESGNTVGMEIADGDYELKHKDGVDYVLRVFDYSLPMEVGQTYTAMLSFNGEYWYTSYMLPVNDIERYQTLMYGGEDYAIAEEIKKIATSYGK